jgi:hypothetical protein
LLEGKPAAPAGNRVVPNADVPVQVFDCALWEAYVFQAAPLKGAHGTGLVGGVVIVDDDVDAVGVLLGANVHELVCIKVQAFGEFLNELDIGLAPLLEARSSTPDQISEWPSWRRPSWFSSFSGYPITAHRRAAAFSLINSSRVESAMWLVSRQSLNEPWYLNATNGDFSPSLGLSLRCWKWLMRTKQIPVVEATTIFQSCGPIFRTTQ